MADEREQQIRERVEHLHSTFIPGCFRCDLGLDEVGEDGRVVIRAGDLRALAAAREENGRLREALEPWANEPCWSPMFDGEVYHEDDHGPVATERLTACGGCPPCKFRAALAREATDAE